MSSSEAAATSTSATTAGAPAGAGLHIAPLQAAHLGAALGLGAEVGWNQTAEDWRVFLDLGRAWGLWTPDGALVGTIGVLPHDGRISWISMLIIQEAWRRGGLGRRMMLHSMAYLQGEGLRAFLDATPAGQPIYERLGFRPLWGLVRLRAPARPAASAALPPGVRPLDEADLARLLSWDEAASPARGVRSDAEDARAPWGRTPRGTLLTRLWRRYPRVALACGERGYLLGRDGRTADQFGPLYARDDATALAIVEGALAATDREVLLDVPAVREGFMRGLQALGFRVERPFTRMVLAAEGEDLAALRAPAEGLYAIAGPELG